MEKSIVMVFKTNKENISEAQQTSSIGPGGQKRKPDHEQQCNQEAGLRCNVGKVETPANTSEPEEYEES